MKTDHPFWTLGIVGGGLTGTSMVYQLMEAIRRRPHAVPDHQARNIRVVVAEQSPVPGPGFPYDPARIFPVHILNMPAGDMSIVADDPDDFVIWFIQHRNWLLHTYPELSEWFPESSDPAKIRRRCLPRMVMGAYLKSRLATAVRRAADLGVTLTVYPRCRIRDMKMDRSHGREILVLTGVDRETHVPVTFPCHCVLLATGHWSRQGRGAFSGIDATPSWPARSLLRAVGKRPSVAVLGTSLSAVDAVLTLTSGGRFDPVSIGEYRYRGETPGLINAPCQRITLYSRNGQLPRVRALKTGTRQNRWVTPERIDRLIAQSPGRLTLDPVFQLFNRELSAGYGAPVNWGDVTAPPTNALTRLKQDIQEALAGDNPDGDIRRQTVLDQAVPLLRKVYRHLLPDQRYRFDTRYKSIFMAHAAPMPLINAKKLAALMETGVVRVRALGNSYRVSRGSGGDPEHAPCRYRIQYADQQGGQVTDTASVLVDATGQSPSYADNPDDLAQSLLASGLGIIDTPPANDLELTKQPNPRHKARSGGLKIDPDTRQVFSLLPGHSGAHPHPRLFAVGVMAPDRIITASMARECVLGTRQVVDMVLNAAP